MTPFTVYIFWFPVVILLIGIWFQLRAIYFEVRNCRIQNDLLLDERLKVFAQTKKE